MTVAHSLNVGQGKLGRIVASLIALVAVVAAVFVAGLPSAAQAGGNPPPPPARIAIKVVDADGKVVPGAIVELMYKGRPLRREMTTRDGLAGFLRVIPAEYGIRAGKREVGVARERVIAKSGETTRVLLTLKKPDTTGSAVSGGGQTGSETSAGVSTAK